MRSLLALLVRLFPRGFREQFGADMVEQVHSDYDRARLRGRLRAIAFALGTGLDLLRASAVERFDPAWVNTDERTIERVGMGMMINEWIRDLRLAGRSLRRSIGFAVIAVVTLGLAIGANAGIFSIVDTVLLDPLPYSHADRLVYIAASAPGSDLPEEFGVSVEFYLQYAEQADLLEDIASFNTFTATLRAGDRAERVRMTASTSSLLSTLGATPILGRLPVPEDESEVAVISHALWTTWFESDPNVIGRSFEMAGESRTVIGVMGPEFWFPNDRTLLWFPFPVRGEDVRPGRFGAGLVARVAPGTEEGALVDQLNRLARRLPERFGGSANYARIIEQHRAVVRPLGEELVGAVAGPLWVLLGSVGIVLLIACANVANLFMARGESRQHLLAVRRAIGASRRQLIRSQMAEAFVIAGFSAVLAVLLATVSVPLFLRAAPANIPRLGDVAVTGSTLLFTLGVSLFAALLCGLLPAIRASAPKLSALRDGGRGSSQQRNWGRNALVVGQTALALVLLIGSALLVRSFWELRHVDPGYDTADVFTFQIAPEGDHLNDAPSYARFHMDFMDRVAALPGVESVGVVENIPLNEGVRGTRYRREDMAGDTEAGTLLRMTWAAGDYFGTMGIEVLRGRPFTESDHTSQLGNAIISESAAELMWPGENPIGRQLQSDGSETWETVVGVVEDVMQYSFRDSELPLVYLPLVGQTPGRAISSPAYVVKTTRANEIAPEVRALVKEVAPGAPMYRIYTMEGLASDSMVQLSFTMLTLGIVSALALVLGAIGLFGVLSYVVAERTREIGVRMALGAEPRRVQKMVVAQGARVVTAGVVIGVGVSLAATRVLGNLLFEVEAVDAVTFVGMSTTMLLVGLLASYLPARRASNVDPIESLRGE
ncbi:MAG: ABC transporter permease [Gemmatimonadota bacterium]